MMRANHVSAGAASSKYYQAEGYYSAGSEEAETITQWFGKAAAELGLEGHVDDKVFSAMLEGQTFEKSDDGLVEGRLMGRYVDGERQHRPGLDLTFSAPKSVSVAALVFGDERLIEVHDKAVRSAMTYVENDLVQTRRVGQGQVEVVNGGKIIAGLFRHDTSRLLDPQLHTHAVVANMVLNPDGYYTALHNDRIFSAQKVGSEIYRNELARGAAELGYDVQRRGKDALVELADVPKELVETFSKRRQEIEAALKEKNMPDNPWTAELAALATRAAKHQNIDRDELRQAWQKEASALRIDQTRVSEILDGTRHRASLRLPGVTRDGIVPQSTTDAISALAKAIDHQSERAVRYRETDLLASALSFARSATPQDVLDAVAAAKASGALIETRVKGERETLLTDQATLVLEREIGSTFRSGSRVPGPLRDGYISRLGNRKETAQAALAKRLGNTTLTEGQRDAVMTALTGRGRIALVQGYAGTGKTFALAQVVKEASKAGFEVEGLAPSSQAVKQLSEAVPRAETLQGRLLRGKSADPDADPRKTILVVDEASMISNTQMRDLLLQAEANKVARVVLVGDVQQLDAVSAGTPFALLQRLGAPTAVMDDIQRQRTEDGRAAVNHAIAGEVKAAFEKLTLVKEAPGQVARTAAEKYLSLSPIERLGAGVVTPTNAMRREINDEIRGALIADGIVGRDQTSLETLAPLQLTRAQLSDPASYQTGEVVVAHQSVQAAGLSRGHIYDVVGHAAQDSAVLLQDRAGGAPFPFAPAQNSKAAAAVNLYEPMRRSFAPGDQIKFRIADREADIKTGDSGRIASITDDTIHVRDAAGRDHEIDRTALAARGIDHAYALTAHDFQGATVEHIIVAMTANETLADQKNFYVSVSRARDQMTLITDYADQLAERLERQTGEKITALEAWVETRLERPDQQRPDPEAERAETDESARNERDEAEKTEARDKDDDKKEAGELAPQIETDAKAVEEAKDELAGLPLFRLTDIERGDLER